MLYLIPYLVGLYLALNIMYGRIRWSFVSDVYDSFSAPLLSGTILKTLINPGHRDFLVTPKGVTHENTRLSSFSGRFYLLLGIQVFASFYGIWILMHDSSAYNQIAVSLAWNAYNMIFTIAALGALIERREVRHRPRIPIDELGGFIINDRHMPCHVVDMTEDGAKLIVTGLRDNITSGMATLKLFVDPQNEQLSSILSTGFRIPVCVRDQVPDKNNPQTTALGISFEFENLEQRRTIINYLYGDSKRWRKELIARHQQSTVTQGVMFVVRSFGYGLLHLWLRLKIVFHVKSTPAVAPSK